MARPRRAKRTLRDIPIPLLYVVAALLALFWSIAAYAILAPNVEQIVDSHDVVWGFLTAFLVGSCGAAAIVTAAYMLAQKIKEA